MFRQSSRIIAALAGLFLAVFSTSGSTGTNPVAGSPEDDQTWRFEVLLGDRNIGTHEFRVSRNGEQEQISIDAEFNVKILFFNAYSYSHQNTEYWSGGCLDAIQAVTDDNGTLYRVNGQSENGQFVIDAADANVQVTPSCTRSFAYWNPAFLDSSQLLNSQSGEIVDVEITRQADEVLSINGNPVAAARYALAMEDGTISLWYGRDSGMWLALEAPAKGGRVLRYVPVELPSEAEQGQQLAFE